MSELPSHIYELPSGEWRYKTSFMHLFDLPEVDVIETEPRWIASQNEYVNLCMNMFYNKVINIPYAKIYNGVGNEYFDFKKEHVAINLHCYGSGCSITAYIKPTDLVNYDMTKISEKVMTTIHFTWDSYKNRKGIIDEIGKLKFLNDLLKHKTYATRKR
jgi:hypothetical protein